MSHSSEHALDSYVYSILSHILVFSFEVSVYKFIWSMCLQNNGCPHPLDIFTVFRMKKKIISH